MKKIFWINPYETEWKTKVEKINEQNELLLEETIIFSFCGGQESDTGWINDFLVLSSRIEGNLIWYDIGQKHNLHSGDFVTLKICWQRRYCLMGLHFATELILEIVTQNFNFKKVGAHISEKKSRIDFNCDQNISQYFPEIIKQYNTIIDKDYVIEKDWLDENNQRRFWKIDGFAEVPCGGTHVKSTKEVGCIILKREKPGKGIERIEIRLES